ncbi:MAG: NAD-dependent epimerase/dehydratase family protein [Pikeienuella sp.]
MDNGKVLLTGVSGFVAGHVAVAMLNAGYAVRGSVRSLSSGGRVRADLAKAGADVSRLEFVALDLLKDEGWDDAMAGVDYLCHCASPFVAVEPDDPQDLIRPAVEGTARALEAALRADIKHIALTSSFIAIGYGDTVLSRPYTPADWSTIGGAGNNAYGDSKTLAEQKAWQIMEDADARERLTTVNPVLVLGPVLNGDLSTSTGIIAKMMRGEFPAAPKIHMPLVDVRDVADLHVLALDPALGGQRLLAGAETVSMLDIAKAVKAEDPTRKKLPTMEAPNFFIRLLAYVDKQSASILHELGKVRRVDASAAEAVLGRKLISAEETTRATARSLIDHGIV